MTRRGRTFQRRTRRPKVVLKRTRGDLPSLGPESILLDFFTDAAAEGWERRAPLVKEYYYRFFFELEAQRAAAHEKLREGLSKAGTTTVPLSGWGRALDWQYCLNPLSAVGSLKWVGGRFNFGSEIDTERFAPFPALYLAENLDTALAERLGNQASAAWAVQMSSEDFALCGESSFSWVRVTGEVRNVFDLTGPEGLQPFVEIIKEFTLSAELTAMAVQLGVKPAEVATSTNMLFKTLVDDSWRGSPTMTDIPANPQIFGKLLCSAGFEGVLYKSQHTGCRNLAVFTRQFVNSESAIYIEPPPPAGVKLASLTASTWKQAEQLWEDQ